MTYIILAHVYHKKTKRHWWTERLAEASTLADAYQSVRDFYTSVDKDVNIIKLKYKGVVE